MQPHGWIYYDEKRGRWQWKMWDQSKGCAVVLGEYRTRSDAYCASYGQRVKDLREDEFKRAA